MTKAFQGIGFVIGEVFTFFMTDDYLVARVLNSSGV
jgi:hypothetical protein